MCAPSMGEVLWVKVLLRADHSEQREVQLREGDRSWGGIRDKSVLVLIRRYLQAGTMVNGVVMERADGTPQCGPLSQLLANVLLDEVDKALERRGHKFARYADDCNVYVHSNVLGRGYSNP
jgi:retron-type reverse transcriptase